MAKRSMYTLITVKFDRCYHSGIDKRAMGTQKTEKCSGDVCQGKLGLKIWIVFVSRKDEEVFGGEREGISYAKAQRHAKICYIWGRIHSYSWIIKCLGYNSRMFSK